MGYWDNVIERLGKGETVSIRPTGSSMTPKILSGQLVKIEPKGLTEVQEGDIVLAKVKGNYYLHLVTAVEAERVQISNNHGYVNGWSRQVFGKVIEVK
jgi:SOS-response transcriptional repressor LexA